MSRIKSVYDLFIAHKENEVFQLTSQIDTLKRNLVDEKTVTGQINRRFKALAAENIELTSDIKEMRKVIDDLQDTHQEKAARRSKDLENKLKVKMEETAKKYQRINMSHKKLTKVIMLCRQKGFPVDFILQNEVNPKNIEQLWIEVPSYCETSQWSENETPIGPVEKSPDFNCISTIVTKNDSTRLI